jgi:hypothetical protein
MERTAIPSSERERYMARLRAKAAHFRAARCRFWVFEDSQVRGSFVEFAEADDARTLAEAHAAIPRTLLRPIPIFHQLELD